MAFTSSENPGTLGRSPSSKVFTVYYGKPTLTVLDPDFFSAGSREPGTTPTGHAAVLCAKTTRWIAAHWPTVAPDTHLRTLLACLINGQRPHLGPDAPIEMDLPDRLIAPLAVPLGWVLFRPQKNGRVLVVPLSLGGSWNTPSSDD